jgi:molybdate transport system ATP-binding protein
MTLLNFSIKKQLKNFELNARLDLAGEDGNVLVLFGASGSGKTMTLKCLAGITDPDSGFISIAGRTVFDRENNLNIKLTERNVGYLPQNYALFPHLNVFDNIAFGLFKWVKTAANQRVKELLGLMQLEGFEKRFPRQLSGGQQQRVAFARALAPNPAILLLDEPFSALDAAIRVELRQNLARLSHRLQLPVVFITHDLEEAFMLADRIAVYDQGQILQYGKREEVFYQPTTPKVANLMGIRNLWEGRVLDVKLNERAVLVRTALFDIWAEISEDKFLPAPAARVTVCVRPEQIVVNPETNPTINRYNVSFAGELARGTLYTLFFRFGANPNQVPDLEVELTAQQRNHLLLNSPNAWTIALPRKAVHLIY